MHCTPAGATGLTDGTLGDGTGETVPGLGNGLTGVPGVVTAGLLACAVGEGTAGGGVDGDEDAAGGDDEGGRCIGEGDGEPGPIGTEAGLFEGLAGGTAMGLVAGGEETGFGGGSDEGSRSAPSLA